MKHFLKLTDMNIQQAEAIFEIAGTIGREHTLLQHKTVILFFPESSIRTRVTFEKGIQLLGGQPVLFPSETLDKKEDIRDVAGYLNNWADCVIVRHKRLELIEKMAGFSAVPVINAMTDSNHPCEVLSDLYALKKQRADYLKLQYTFIGADGNIGRAWQEAALAFGFAFRQCCPGGYEIPGAAVIPDIAEAIQGSDVILTDPLPEKALGDFQSYQVTTARMQQANAGALLNPCPPFTRGGEVSADVIESDFFVGYSFKAALLQVQQAMIAYLMRQ